MKIVVIGASRGIGLEVVKQGLERGHEVTALLRHPAKLTLEHARLHKVQGDVGEPKDVRTALTGQDAVCTCVGVNPTRKPVELFSRGARNVLAALQDAPATKYVAVTGIGAGDSRGHGGFLYDKIFQPLLLGTIYADKDREEELIKASASRLADRSPRPSDQRPAHGSLPSDHRSRGSDGGANLARGCRRFHSEPVGESQPVQASAAAELLTRMGGGWKAG